MSRNGQQKWTRTGNCDSFALNRKSAFDERLQAARSKDSWERPAGKGQESLTRSSGQNETVVLKGDHLWIAGCLADGLEHLWGRCIEDAVAGEKSRSGREEVTKRPVFFEVFCPIRVPVGGFDPSAPDLSSGCGVVVQEKHTESVPGRGCGSRDAGGPGAHNDDIGVFHRSDSTTMPSRQVS